MTQDSLLGLTKRLREFATDRDWEQFHSPKNLAMAITAEVGELAAEFQWLSPSESLSLGEDHLARVKDEAADVLNYLVRLADRLGFDLIEATNSKIDRNALKYPIALAKGSAKKYNQY